LGWVFGWEWKGREGGWKASVGEEKGVDWTGLGKKRWVHVCLEGQWHVNVTGQVRSRFGARVCFHVTQDLSAVILPWLSRP
jgi:hypothetical protein